MRDNYTPLLRMCAWAALVFGFVFFFVVFFVTVQMPDIPGQVFSIRTLGFLFGIGALLVWILVFALLQTIASMADAVEVMKAKAIEEKQPV